MVEIMYITSTMISEVERNQKLIRLGDVVNFEHNWEVVELFDGGFSIKDDYETKDFMFNELQLGWTISEKTKKQNTELLHLRYV